MAFLSSHSSFVLMMLLSVSSFIFSPIFAKHACPIQAIYQFGDSINDAGNLIRIGPVGTLYSRLPYGQSFPNGPTGRCSDGMLIIDYLAASLKLPLINPYLDKKASFENGANFAVAACTALDESFFKERGVPFVPTGSSLNRQLEWFRLHLKSTCRTPTACANKLKKSLIMMGEIGGNDYNYYFLQRRPVEEIRDLIPHVVKTISDAVREVIHMGAKNIVVPGNFPLGCWPAYLSQIEAVGGYDDMGCISYLNDFAKLHNYNLQNALAQLRREFPSAIILYSDYYSAIQSILHRGRQLGFDPSNALKSCCGLGGQHNFNMSTMCGLPGVPVCADPNKYIHWDGVHLTQNAYRRMSEILIPPILSEIKCK